MFILQHLAKSSKYKHSVNSSTEMMFEISISLSLLTVQKCCEQNPCCDIGKLDGTYWVRVKRHTSLEKEHIGEGK